MNSRNATAAMLVVVVLLSLATLKVPLGPVEVQAQAGTARLEVWNDFYRSSNITDLTRTQGQISLEVNVTGAGLLNGFDVSLNYYNLTIGSPVLDAVGTQASLAGGLIDPDNPPAACPTIFVLKNEVDAPQGSVRVAVAILGGCTVDGTGTLFTLTFDIIGTGVAAIDIIQTDTGGKPKTQLAASGANVEYDAFSATFRNKPGTPPVADFILNPAAPVKNDTVTFDGTLSFDPNNSTGPDKGIRRWLWSFGDGTGRFQGSLINHKFIAPPVSPLAGNFTVTLIVYDYGDGLASRKTVLVNVSPGTVHDIALSINASANELREGEAVRLTLTVTNNGNRNELANLTVTYNYQGATQIGKESMVNLTTLSRQKAFEYTLQTGGLPARQYAVTATGFIVNATTGEMVPDAKPLDNTSIANFSLQASGGTSSLSLPIFLGVGVAGVLGGTWLVLRLARRKKEET